jgi:hypothetical protein
MIARLVRWLGHGPARLVGQWLARPTRRPTPDDDIGAYI